MIQWLSGKFSYKIFPGIVLGFFVIGQNFVYAAGGLVKIALQPSDLDFKYQKNYLERVNIPAAWDYQIKGNLRPVIAILDSGVDIDNPDLKSNIWFNPWEVPGDKLDNDNNGFTDDVHGWDFVANSPDPRPKFESGWNELAVNHGTIVAGVAAAVGDNNLGVAGVAFQARLMPLRVLDGRGVGDTTAVARAVNYAIDKNADIINLSFVGDLSDPDLEVAIARAAKLGILVVAASGNDQTKAIDMDFSPQYPVCSDGPVGSNWVIGVAALGENNQRAEFSNFGAGCVDLSAPGTNIYSTQLVVNGNTKFKQSYGGGWSGTSVATPLISGSLAFLKAAFPRLSPSQLRDVLIASGDEILGSNGKVGRKLNLKAAVDLAGSTKFPRKNPIIVGYQTGPALISTLDISSEVLQKFTAYDSTVKGGVNLTAGDIDDDGQTDIITAPRAGSKPQVRIFNQKGELEFEFLAFPEFYLGGLSVASADFTGEGESDIVVGTGSRASNLVRIFDGSGRLFYQFAPYDFNYLGGVQVATGDIDGDKNPEIIVAPQGKNNLPIRVFDKFGNKKLEFWAWQAMGKGGVNISAGDLTGDAKSEIIVARGAGSEPEVKIFDGKGKLIKQFFAFAKSFRGGVQVAVGDTDGNGNQEVVTVPATSGGPQIRIFNKEGKAQAQFFMEPTNWRGGLNVAIFK